VSAYGQVCYGKLHLGKLNTCINRFNCGFYPFASILMSQNAKRDSSGPVNATIPLFLIYDELRALQRYISSKNPCSFCYSPLHSSTTWCPCGNACTTERKDHTVYYEHLAPMIICLCKRKYTALCTLRLHIRQNHPDFNLPTRRQKSSSAV